MSNLPTVDFDSGLSRSSRIADHAIGYAQFFLPPADPALRHISAFLRNLARVLPVAVPRKQIVSEQFFQIQATPLPIPLIIVGAVQNKPSQIVAFESRRTAIKRPGTMKQHSRPTFKQSHPSLAHLAHSHRNPLAHNKAKQPLFGGLC
jgi:hypothetical protein